MDGFVMRSLDEIQFWSRIMKEHSLFLKLGFRCEDTQLIQEANGFYALFEQIEARSHAFSPATDPEQIRKFNTEVFTAANPHLGLQAKDIGADIKLQAARRQ